MRGGEKCGALGGQPPSVADRRDRRRSPSTVFRLVGREECRPRTSEWRRDQRLGERVSVEPRTEVHDEQPVVSGVTEEPKHESRVRDHGAVESARAARAKHRIIATNAKQVAMQIHRLDM
jgi:hypothetical protein